MGQPAELRGDLAMIIRAPLAAFCVAVLLVCAGHLGGSEAVYWTAGVLSVLGLIIIGAQCAP